MREEIIRKIDSLGRIVIPLEYRNKLGWTECTQISISIKNGQINLRVFQSCCDFCGSKENIRLFKEKHICEKCISEINGI